MIPLIALHGVGRRYSGPPAVTALHDINVHVGRGDFLTVTGPSGSGKSTLLNILGLLDRPTEGRYDLNGIDVSELPERQRAAVRGRRIGFVFQAYHLLKYRSAAENVMLAMLYSGAKRRQREDTALSALDRVGLAARASFPPARLSGGEQQRVAIARALAARSDLLLCDEPTGNLDSSSAAAVLGLIAGLNRDGLTVVVITHDPSVAALGSRRLAMRDGTLEPAG